MDEISRIMALSDAFGASGFEDKVAEFVREELQEFRTEQDHMRNVRCQDEGPADDRPRVMLDSHLDEVGLIVQAIRPNGTMTFLTLGYWSATSLPSSSFRILTRDGRYVPAVVSAKPPHFMSQAERGAAVDIAAMVLDCGTGSKAETEALGIGIGSPAVPDITCRYEEDRRLFCGKAFDCRIGVAAEIETLKRLRGKELPCRVLGAFSTQEEVGERGVRANVLALKPDVMICFEGCPADDTFAEDWRVQTALRKGPMLRDSDVSMITNWRFQRFVLDIAAENKIPVQRAVRSGGGTNAAVVNSDFGIPSIVIGVPVRYIHSPNCFCTLEDYQYSVELAVKIAEKLDRAALESL